MKNIQCMVAVILIGSNFLTASEQPSLEAVVCRAQHAARVVAFAAVSQTAVYQFSRIDSPHCIPRIVLFFNRKFQDIFEHSSKSEFTTILDDCAQWDPTTKNRFCGQVILELQGVEPSDRYFDDTDRCLDQARAIIFAMFGYDEFGREKTT